MSSYDKIIKDHYDSVAKSDKDSASSTMSNSFIRNSETDFIVNQIKVYLKKLEINNSDISLIDVGCGNGYTLEIISNRFTFNFHGIELTDSLRKIAYDWLNNQKIKINKGDIRKRLDLTKENSKF